MFTRTLGLVLAAATAAGAVGGAVAAKLHSRHVAARAAICDDVGCDHLFARKSVIKSMSRQIASSPSYLVIGDSITEGTELKPLCGRMPLNAGIGWATTTTFASYAQEIAEFARPDFIVIALGTNDALLGRETGFGDRMRALLATLPAVPTVLVPLTPGPQVQNTSRFNAALAAIDVPAAAPLALVETIEDGVHLTAKGYRDWRSALEAAVDTHICPALSDVQATPRVMGFVSR